VIFDAVLALRLDIGDVRLGNVCRGGSANFMDVHVHRHSDLRKRDVSTFDFTPVRLECGQTAAT
jgi:hypothetical protein